MTRDGKEIIPLSERKEELLQYLYMAGPSVRQNILRGTGMPAGSLSVLLHRGHKEKWLIRHQGGVWEPASEYNNRGAGI